MEISTLISQLETAPVSPFLCYLDLEKSIVDTSLSGVSASRFKKKKKRKRKTSLRRETNKKVSFLVAKVNNFVKKRAKTPGFRK